MAKSKKKKNYKLRRRVMRTVAALTMIMAIVVAAIPVENLGTMQAAGAKDLDKAEVETDIQNAKAEYNPSIESAYTTQKTVQRIRENNGTLSLVNMFTVKTDSNNDAIIVDDIIGDGNHGETELTINQTEYCDYVQFDTDFIKAITDALDTASDFTLTFGVDSTIPPLTVTNPAATVQPIKVETIKKDTPTPGSTVQPTINIGTNDKAQGYTNFSGVNLNPNTIYSQEFGKALYDAKIAEIDAYNTRVNAFVTKVNNFITKVSAPNYTWDATRDGSEWSVYENEAKGFDAASTAQLTKDYLEFENNEENGLNGIVDYIIRNYCKKGSSDLQKYRLRSLQTQSAAGDLITVYVPQYTEPGIHNWLDENNFLPATGNSKVNIKGIGSNAFATTTLNKITLPTGLEFIGKQAFYDSSLTEVTINTTNCGIIGEEAFANCGFLKTVNFSRTGAVDSKKFITIDKKAFYNTALASVTIPSPVMTIGVAAFAGGRDLKSVIFEDTGRGSDINIGKYAFFDCDGLTEVIFPENNQSQYKIEKGAFALGTEGGSLTSFRFPGGNTDINYGTGTGDEYDYILANRNTLENVTFPGKLGSKIPDNTLTDCQNLSWVKFPEGAKNAWYDETILFADVWNNPNFYVEGPELLNAPGSRSKPRETTWKAKAGNLGPADNDPNKIKWALSAVPYKYTDSSGKVHFEIGVGADSNGEPQYIARIDVTDENKKEATLVKFSPNKNTLQNNISIEIPSKVGEYTVVAIGPDCFDDKIKDKISELIINDGSIREIADGAFRDSANLQWVHIGNSVARIGKEAFAGCPNLENVEFSQTDTFGWYGSDNNWEAALTIGENAFKTGSKRLTFHGAIHPDYAPFKLAMSENNEEMLQSKSRICYQTDAPLNLKVIRSHEYTVIDEKTKQTITVPEQVTLIDYPHYEEIDTINEKLRLAMQEEYNKNHTTTITNYSITDKFEVVNGVREGASGEPDYKTEAMGDAEEAVVTQTLELYIPKGIESIDSMSYFMNTANSNDFEYLEYCYERKENTDNSVEYNFIKQQRNVNSFGEGVGKTIQQLYSTFKGTENTKDQDIIPGLLSGYFDESYIATDPSQPTTRDGGGVDGSGNPDSSGLIWYTHAGHYYTEKNDRGNDYLTKVEMPSVSKIPAYGFDSNENVKELTIGKAMEEIGLQPFRDCKSLWKIDTTDSTKYAYENMILYDTDPAEGKDGYKIIQGLEGRGSEASDPDAEYGSNKITATSNPLLSQVAYIAPYAFANNEEVVEVDLSKTNIRDIENGAFNGSGNLMKVVLSEKTKVVGDFAFGGVNANNFTLEVPNKDCQISQKAFKRDDEDTSSSIKGVTIKGIKYDENGDRSTTYDSFLKLQETYGENRVEWAEIGKTHTLNFYDQQTLQLIASVKVETKEGETSATMVGNPPTPPGHTGYEFDYWMCPKILDANGNPLLDAATWTDVTEDRDIYAVYKRSPETVVPDGKDYTLTVVNGKALVKDANGELQLITTFPLTLKGGTQVTIMANDEPNFKTWSTSPVKYQSLLQNSGTYTTTLTMPSDNLTVTANSAIGGNTPNPDGTYTVTVNNGTGSGQYKPGATVTITANKPNTGASFVNWTTATSGVSFASATSATTTFVMPSSNVTVTANFSDGSGGQPGGDDSKKKYKVTVNYGTGSGEYEVGATVNITANAPESSSRVFSRWTTSNSSLGFANANASSTSFVMPAADVTVTANYKTKSKDDDDDDDDDSPSRRPGSSSSTNTVPNRPGSSSTTGTTGTVTDSSTGSGNTSGTTNSSDGNKIYITKNGISNTDVASLAVSGSTDNFIVRITESPEATAAVEQALTNSYGSLEGLAYLPMDISLYDSTGQNKITDTHGLNITVTMPIPDVLIQYGGNARVAAADNGNLQQITPRFTTIDGIACISFVPPHFSPYVIYVDTNNLIAGQMLDATPATGDPIHPKWFAAIGMACVSVLLFVASDGRKRKKFRAA